MNVLYIRIELNIMLSNVRRAVYAFCGSFGRRSAQQIPQIILLIRVDWNLI